ncbi:MAG: carboxypeptidase regulatory-like domain-containing protein [Anaerolineales bacterium]|nr:carboxypeptidase regulatory-like domain-containing protein [Anaerolineales bacterium]
MTRLIRPILFVVILLTFTTSALAGTLPDPGPDGQLPAGMTPWLYLPFLSQAPEAYLVSGQVTDASANPLPGAVITDDAGNTTTTDDNGNYTIALPEGQHALAPEKSGYVFTPSVSEIQVEGSLSGQDFVALAACSDYVTNGGFEANTWWNFPSSDAIAAYSTALWHSGARSVRTGILNPGDNVYSYSSARSQILNLPVGATSITLRAWLNPRSGEVVTSALPPEPVGPQLEQASPDEAAAFDAQYVLVLNTSNDLLETLMWVRSNSQVWTYYSFDLTKWRGQSIKLQFGTYNDGAGGVTAMYVDDVSLEVCTSSPPPPPPPPPACVNQILNSGFEYNGNWGIPTTPYPAGYSYDYSYVGSRSMRTGIPLYSMANVYSYSDAWQTITIPSDATSAVLRVRLWPQSQEPAALSEEAIMPEVGSVWGESDLAADSQYFLILNPYTQVIREYLASWTNKNSAGWLYREYNLIAYRGQSIRIQFGTYNDGYGGRTAMYVDEIYVDTCTSTPPPPPPPGCTEKVSNGGFENNSAWYAPLTAFSAGYSTFFKHNGARSMRTGIYYQSQNRYSYSDVRQTVTLPASLSSANLSFWIYSLSGEAYAAVPMSESPTSAEWSQEASAGDVQYLLILDAAYNWIDTLIWRRSNEQYWHYYSFDLRPYAGSTINLQFGTYNNGYSGVTAMYVDDVSLWVCP